MRKHIAPNGTDRSVFRPPPVGRIDLHSQSEHAAGDQQPTGAHYNAAAHRQALLGCDQQTFTLRTLESTGQDLSVSLHVIDILGIDLRVKTRISQNGALCRRIRCRKTIGRSIVIDRTTTQQGEYSVTVS